MYEREVNVIEFNNVTKTYENGTEAIHDINLHIHKGEFVFVIGESGAGKSTLLKLMMREETPDMGTLRIGNFYFDKMKKRDIPKLRRTMGIVFQDFRLIPNMTVYENVAYAMRVVGEREKNIGKRVTEVLQMVGIDNKAKSMPNELSGGEQQRVSLARALVNNPEVILADEPTGNLDPHMSDDIIQLLMQFNKQGKTIVVVTHEHSLVRKFTYRTIKISRGQIVEDKPASGIYAKKRRSSELRPLDIKKEESPVIETEEETYISPFIRKDYPVKRINDVDREFFESRLSERSRGGNKE